MEILCATYNMEWRRCCEKRLLAISFICMLGIYGGSGSYCRGKDQVPLAKAKSAILIERDTGTVLFEKNSHEPLPPASMTKIMTMLLIMEALEEGKLRLDEKVRTQRICRIDGRFAEFSWSPAKK